MSIYTYLWTHIEPGPEADRYKAFHSSEIPYVFGTLDTSSRPFTAQDRAVSDRMMKAWVSWITYANPNGRTYGEWKPYAVPERLVTTLGDTAKAQPILPAENLAIFKAQAARGAPLAPF